MIIFEATIGPKMAPRRLPETCADDGRQLRGLNMSLGGLRGGKKMEKKQIPDDPTTSYTLRRGNDARSTRLILAPGAPRDGLARAV